MKEIIQKRSEELKKEFELGQQRLQELEKQQLKLQETLLRISGAIQVLEETLNGESSDEQPTLGQSE